MSSLRIGFNLLRVSATRLASLCRRFFCLACQLSLYVESCHVYVLFSYLAQVEVNSPHQVQCSQLQDASTARIEKTRSTQACINVPGIYSQCVNTCINQWFITSIFTSQHLRHSKTSSSVLQASQRKIGGLSNTFEDTGWIVCLAKHFNSGFQRDLDSEASRS